MSGSKSYKGESIGTSDTNKTTKIDAQGPLEETLAAYDEYDINKMKDPTPKKYSWKTVMGSNPKP